MLNENSGYAVGEFSSFYKIFAFFSKTSIAGFNNHFEKTKQLIIYPNPSTEQVYLQINSPVERVKCVNYLRQKVQISLLNNVLNIW